MTNHPVPKGGRMDVPQLNRQITELRLQPENFSGTIVDLLNDDCLLQIFENPIISATDLLQLAYTCKRFHSIAKKAFSKKVITSKFFIKLELPQTEKFFRTFGECIKSVNFDSYGRNESRIRLCLMVEHCKNITSFECIGIQHRLLTAWIAGIGSVIISIVPMLEKLSICGEPSYGCRVLFRENIEYRLKELNISYWVNLPMQRLSQLETVSLSNNWKVSPEDVVPFFNLNPQIKSLKLEHLRLSFDISQILDHLPNLMELELSFVRNNLGSSSTNVDCYRRLNRLKMLKILPIEDVQILYILRALCDGQTKLEKLFWAGKCEPSVIDAVCKLKSITHLELIHANSNKNVTRLVENLKNLVYIKATCETFEGIHNALRSARCLKEAQFKINSMTLTEQRNVSSILDAIDLIRCERRLQLTVFIEKVRYCVPTNYYYQRFIIGSGRSGYSRRCNYEVAISLYASRYALQRHLL